MVLHLVQMILDAVNVSQLKASNARIGDAIGQVARVTRRCAAAMAALKPIQYDPLNQLRHGWCW